MKKRPFLFQLVLILIVLFVSVNFAMGQTTCGDVNEDEATNIIDALIISQCYVSLIICPSFDIGDVNCDGQINIVDALIASQFYVGLISQLNCCGTPTPVDTPTPTPIGTPISTPIPTTTPSETDADTQFLYGRGFYDNPFTEVISTGLQDAQIIYTLDGSDPRTSSTYFTGQSPLEVIIDPSDDSNRPLTPAITLRAYARTRNGGTTTNVDTQTYIFVENVKIQSAQSPGGGWPEPVPRQYPRHPASVQILDFGMDSQIVNDPQYQDLMTDALKSIPSFSIVTDLRHLFDPYTGIFVNADGIGVAWERPVSIEIIYPDGSDSVQAEAGMRIRGGYFVGGFNPKHSFRFFFKEEYGDAKLNYKLFEDEGVEEFDKMDLRTATNYSWAIEGNARNAMLRDVVCRDMQGVTNQPYTKSRYYHLYLDGLYWGLYQTQERAEARYARSYFGGHKEDYDVIKSGAAETGYLLEAADGTLDLTYQLHSKMIAGFESDAAYFDILGRNPDGTINPNGQKLVDPENLIDYMLNIFYSGDKDGPISTFIDRGQGINNFYGIINRNNPDGFKWFHHDAEHTLDLGANDRIGPFSGFYLDRPERFNPQTLNQYLMENTEYKMLLADRTYRHFELDDSAFRPASVSAQINFRAQQIDPGGVIAQSARWGDAVEPNRRTYDDWLSTINNILNSYIPTRTSQIINLLQQKDWYPDIDPPTVRSGAQLVSVRITDLAIDTQITLESTQGRTIYYTIDGSDPRAIGGSISASAYDGGTSTIVSLPAEGIKARIQNGSEWSPLRELYNRTPYLRDDLQISEIHYHPIEDSVVDEQDYEFVELHNNTAGPINLTGFSFTKGILYKFPAGTVLHAGEYLVLCAVPREFKKRYGFDAFDDYDGKLENSGDKLTVRDAFGTTIFSVAFDDSAPWPESPDDLGYSLVPMQLNSVADPDDSIYWTASAQVHGSPGVKDANTN